MLYCELCMMLCEDDGVKCPECGNKKLRPPKGNDPVHILSKEALWSGGIEETLKEAGIPCLKQKSRGTVAGILLGELSEIYRYFVPYGALEQSRELLLDFIESPGDENGDEEREWEGEDHV